MRRIALPCADPLCWCNPRRWRIRQRLAECCGAFLGRHCCPITPIARLVTACLARWLGGVIGAVSLGTGWRLVLAGMLALAALLMFAQASARIAALLPRLAAPRLPGLLEARLGPLLAAPTGLRGIALGFMLSALPCGLLYGALAGAAATGSALGEALAMVSFVAGTVPALVGVALLGRFFGKSHGRLMRGVAAGLFVLNGVVLAVMALRMLG